MRFNLHRAFIALSLFSSFPMTSSAAILDKPVSMLKLKLSSPVIPSSRSFVIEEEIVLNATLEAAAESLKTLMVSASADKNTHIVQSSDQNEFCLQSLTQSFTKSREQKCSRLVEQDDGTVVYHFEMIVDGAYGVIRARSNEAHLRAEIRAELESFQADLEAKSPTAE